MNNVIEALHTIKDYCKSNNYCDTCMLKLMDEDMLICKIAAWSDAPENWPIDENTETASHTIRDLDKSDLELMHKALMNYHVSAGAETSKKDKLIAKVKEMFDDCTE